MERRAHLPDSGRQRREEPRDNASLPGAMPGAEMTTAATHRGARFDPERSKQAEADEERAGAMRRGFAQKHEGKQDEAADSDDAKKGRRLDNVYDRLERAGIFACHR